MIVVPRLVTKRDKFPLTFALLDMWENYKTEEEFWFKAMQDPEVIEWPGRS